MGESSDKPARFRHVFSSPLTAMRGAIELLRHPGRLGHDPVTRELLDALERNYARLNQAVEVLLAHAAVDESQVEIVLPLHLLGVGGERTPPNQAPEPPAAAAGQTFPLNEGVAETSPTRAASAILLVGVLAGRRDALVALLEGAGYKLLLADDGAEGIDLARARRPDLIVIDLDLDALVAQQVAQVLREDPDTKSVPIIYAAGQAPPPASPPAHVEIMPRDAAPDALLDLAEQSIAAARARAEQVPTLLIVDDDDDIRRVETLHFQQDGYRVVPVATGAAALMAAQKHSFDLVILDLLLPDIDGLSVLAALRARTASALTPIILLSAKDSPQEKVHGLQLGADDYVTKPFSAAELQARVRAALRRHEREAGANPSTRLPGNIAIERALRSRIDQSQPFAICYADIDNFKAYNDTYGFLKGDAVIQQTARVLIQGAEQQGNRDDFVGHIGGDDFIVITTPDRAEPICAHATASFDQLAPLFYDGETRRRGYIDALDRQGRPTRFPFMSLSIGIVSTDRHPIRHVAEVAQRSVDPKKHAKDLPGSAYVFED